MKYALDGIYSFINAALETTLAAIDSEDGTTTERWKTFTTYEARDLQFPLIEALPKQTSSEYGSDESPLTEHWETHAIDLEVAIAGQDAEAIQEDLLRYREAFVRIVGSDSTFGGLFNRVQLGLAEYSPIIESVKEKKLVKILRQSISVRNLRT
jgi:hypothetical protein